MTTKQLWFRVAVLAGVVLMVLLVRAADYDFTGPGIVGMDVTRPADSEQRSVLGAALRQTRSALSNSVVGLSTTNSLATNAYMRFGSGLTYQWGSVGSTGIETIVVSLPIAFTGGVFQVFISNRETNVCGMGNSPATTPILDLPAKWYILGSPTLTNFSIRHMPGYYFLSPNWTVYTNASYGSWLAIGY